MRHFAMPVRSRAISASGSLAAVAVLALGLTACGGSDEDTSASATPSASGSVTASAEASPKATAEGAAADDAAAEGSATGGGKSDSGSAGTAAKAAPCADTSLSLTVEHIDERTHELIRVTNKGAKACTVLNAPMVSFDDLDGSATVMANTTPKNVVTLDSGATAYAALVLDPKGTAETEGKEVTTFHVGLEGPQGGVLSAKLPGAPVKSSEAEVTAWQPSMNDLATIGF